MACCHITACGGVQSVYSFMVAKFWLFDLFIQSMKLPYADLLQSYSEFESHLAIT